MIDPAPASARNVTTTYSAIPSGGAYAVSRMTTWKCPRLDGWDGDCTSVKVGLSRVEAEDLASLLNGFVRREAA